MGSLFNMFYHQCLIIKTRIALVGNIIVQRLDIYGALGIVKWVMPLVEHIKDSTYFVSIFIVFLLFYFSAIIASISC